MAPVPPQLTPFKPGNIANPNGRPIGIRSRSTIAKKILSMQGALPAEILKEVQKLFPQVVNQGMTVEDIMTITQAGKAIRDGDTSAYRAVLDSAYGLPKQQISGKFGIGNLLDEAETTPAPDDGEKKEIE